MKTIQSSKVFSLHQSLSHSKLLNQIEYCQKTISVIRCSLAVLYDNLRSGATLLKSSFDDSAGGSGDGWWWCLNFNIVFSLHPSWTQISRPANSGVTYWWTYQKQRHLTGLNWSQKSFCNIHRIHIFLTLSFSFENFLIKLIIPAKL